MLGRKLTLILLLSIIPTSADSNSLDPNIGVNDNDTFSFVLETYQSDWSDGTYDIGFFIPQETSEEEIYLTQGDEMTLSITDTTLVNVIEDTYRYSQIRAQIHIEGMTYDTPIDLYLDHFFARWVVFTDWAFWEADIQSYIDEIAPYPEYEGSSFIVDNGIDTFVLQIEHTADLEAPTSLTYREFVYSKSTGVLLLFYTKDTVINQSTKETMIKEVLLRNGDYTEDFEYTGTIENTFEGESSDEESSPGLNLISSLFLVALIAINKRKQKIFKIRV